ncbi:Protein-glutamine gamma-glutamyltransferase [compost metagenome]
MEKIFSEFTYDAAATQVATPLQQVLEEKRGVCQDFAHLMLACLRSRGLAARYVSGYLLTQPPPGRPRLIGADASHAWVSVWCPRLGWVDFDPTNNLIPALEHITLAWGRDFGDVSPLRGVILGGGSHDPEVSVTVMPLAEALARGV